MAQTRSAAVTTAAFALALSSAGAADAKVLLGSKHFTPNSQGFGTAKPRKIDNGGDASGTARKIRWRHWGSAVARGHGLNPLFKPGGGYFSKLARIDFRAEAIGTCPGESAQAYTKLYARVPKKPGGTPGKWFPWAGSDSICSFDVG